jgi:hypothetical protein
MVNSELFSRIIESDQMIHDYEFLRIIFEDLYNQTSPFCHKEIEILFLN